MKRKRVKMLSEEEQLKKIDRATDKALHEIEKERKDNQETILPNGLNG